MKVLRFTFKTNNCEFRAIKDGTRFKINDRRTKANKQYREFGNMVLSTLKYQCVKVHSYWTEMVQKHSCILAVQVMD